MYCKSILHLFKYSMQYTKADAVHICGKFWDTQYPEYQLNKKIIHISSECHKASSTISFFKEIFP